MTFLARLTVIYLGLNLLFSAGAMDPADPTAELASFTVAEGFEVNLFASEKEGVVKPIQIRFDNRGRLWVIGSTVYPQLAPGQVPNDKVLILEDQDQDGRAEKTTIFADGLMIPTGLELGHRGVYVGHGTELLFLKDTDGDDKADERHVVLRGFGTGDNHQNINSFLWGPGGELWMCQGLHIRSNVETPWGIVRLNEAGLWRFRPRLKKLEGFYGSANEPQNPWGYVFTDWGEPIVLAGNNSSHIYPVPGLTSRHLDLPPAHIWRNGQGRKSSGGDFVGTTHFPDDWQGVLLTGGYINNAVWALKILDDGAGFALEDLPPLIKSTDRSFRPVDVKFGPDGAAYICDWYNPIIGHYQASFRHPDRDKTHGRIWRVTAKDRSLTKPPAIATATTLELINLLQSNDRWTRKFANRSLADRPTKEVIPELRAWLTKYKPDDRTLKEILGIFQSHEIVNEELLLRLARSPAAGARAYAAYATGLWADRLVEPLKLLAALGQDLHPRVRLQAVVAASYIPQAEAIEVVAKASELPTDRFLEYGLKQAVFALKPYWLSEFTAGRLKLADNPHHLNFLVRADGTPDTLDAVRALLEKDEVPPGSRENLHLALIEHGSSEDLSFFRRIRDPEMRKRVLKALNKVISVKAFKQTKDNAQFLSDFIQDPHPGVRSEIFRLVGNWKHSEFNNAILDAANNHREAIAVRLAAVEALGKLGGEVNSAQLRTLTMEEPVQLRAAAIIALVSAANPVEGSIAAAKLAQIGEAAACFDSIFAAFLQQKDGAKTLAKAFSETAIDRKVAEAGLLLMNSTGRRNEELAAVLSRAIGVSEFSQSSFEEMTALIAEVQSRGNVERGASIYRRAELGCIACHSVKGVGGSIGPDLGAVGTAQPIDFIIGAILDPQKEVKEGYISTLITTRDGDEYQGYLTRESEEEFVVRDPLQGSEVRIRRDQVLEKKESGSVMPAGLVDALSREEFRDLVRYLSELGR